MAGSEMMGLAGYRRGCILAADYCYSCQSLASRDSPVPVTLQLLRHRPVILARLATAMAPTSNAYNYICCALVGEEEQTRALLLVRPSMWSPTRTDGNGQYDRANDLGTAGLVS